MASAGVVLGSVAVCENLHPSLTGHTRHTRHTARQTTNPKVTALQHDFAGALGGFAPWAAMKMFHFTGGGLHSAHASAAQAPSGARTVLGAPQKVNIMHSQASHAAGKFSGAGAGRPARSQTPNDSADLLTEKPAPSGHPGGSVSAAGVDKGLQAASAAKPLGASAGSSAAGTGSSAAAVGSVGAASVGAAAVAAPIVVAAATVTAAKKVATAGTNAAGQAAPAPPKSPIQE